MRSLTIASLFAACFVALSKGECPKDTVSILAINSSCIYMSPATETLDMYAANKKCEALGSGGSLYEPKSEREMGHVLAHYGSDVVGDYDLFWLGYANMKAKKGEETVVESYWGGMSNKTNMPSGLWARNQPLEYAVEVDNICTAGWLKQVGLFSLSCDRVFRYICQVPK
ncbi:uncharacterized protein LOC142354259 [Convolutriloba macropyga]|uniref:uncharacterized protein LOC142354259 n=1 Tax=Convolutriloba macropyga TaxID=536237 RepID=UPI003F523F91